MSPTLEELITSVEPSRQLLHELDQEARRAEFIFGDSRDTLEILRARIHQLVDRAIDQQIGDRASEHLLVQRWADLSDFFNGHRCAQ